MDDPAVVELRGRLQTWMKQDFENIVLQWKKQYERKQNLLSIPQQRALQNKMSQWADASVPWSEKNVAPPEFLGEPS